MPINISKLIDQWYLEWSGVEHTVNACHPVHDSADAQDFAGYCIKEFIAMSADPKVPSKVNEYLSDEDEEECIKLAIQNILSADAGE